MTNKIQPCRRRIRDIRLLCHASLHETILHRRIDHTPIISVQSIFPRHDCKVGQRNLIRIAIHDRRHPEVVRLHGRLRDMQLVVAAIVEFLPLQLAVSGDEPFRGLHALGDGDVGAVRAGRGDGRAGEFDTDGAGACDWVVGVVIEPDEVGDPVGVAVAGDHDVVGDVVGVESLECPVAVCLITIPSIIIEGVDVPVGDGLVDAAEDGLRADYAPLGPAILRAGILLISKTCGAITMGKRNNSQPANRFEENLT